MGWNLTGFGISRITRCGKTVAQDGDPTPIDFTDADAFCLDGQRLLATGDPAVNGKTVYTTERDPFTRVLFDPQAKNFEVDLPDGRVLSYGTTSASQHRSSRVIWVVTPNGSPGRGGDATVTYAWGLDSVRDPIGNHMDISYTAFHDDVEALAWSSCTELLPQTISYTAGPSSPALRSVTFTYEKPASPEPSCKFVSGFGIGSQARLHQIDMSGPWADPSAGPTGLRSYKMSYHTSVIGRSLLASVQECSTNNLCKPPTTFDYDSGAGPGEPAGTPKFNEALGALSAISSGTYAAPRDFQFVDLNGDGKDDVVFRVWNTDTTSPNYYGEWISP